MSHNELQWQTDRANLRRLHLLHPDWSRPRLAQALSRSLSWVKKWLKRLAQALPDDLNVLWSKSTARKHSTSPTPPHPLLVSRILELRDHPPAELGRTPGPKTLRYYLQQDPLLREAGLLAPTSTRVIWKILSQNGRIARPGPQKPHQTQPRPEPLAEW